MNYSDKEYMGCCGAYCKTCFGITEELCKGCKIGYINGERDLNKAKCKMKVCCMEKKYSTCAECPKFETCNIINEFFRKNGYKYKKYQEAIMYIRNSGYESFFKIANKWNKQYGKYEVKDT